MEHALELKTKIIESVEELIKAPSARPFLFRTRFERSMLRIVKFAEFEGNYELRDLAKASHEKMRLIIDKSNTSADGMLRSYALLLDDMQVLLEKLAA